MSAVGLWYIIRCYKHDGTIHRVWDRGLVLENNADYIVIASKKAKVVEVVLNRLDSQNSDFYSQNTVYKVLTEPNQFTGAGRYVDLGCYSSEVTSSCIEAVRAYLAGEFTNHGYLYFHGDDYANYFSVDYWG